MKVLISVFMVVTFLFIAGSPFSPLIPSDNIRAMPDTATNLQIHSFTNYYPINSNILMFAYARTGREGTDTLYNGTGFVKFFEEIGDSSFYSTIAGPEDYYHNFADGECIFFISNADTEMVAMRLEDSTDIIKPSFYTNIEFKPKADTATCIKGIEDTLLLISMPLTFFVRYEDDSNAIYFDYASLMTDSTMKVTLLDNADSAVTIASLGSSSHTEIYPMIINGGYYIQVYSDAVKSFDIVFEPLLASPPIAPDTVHYMCLPNSESPLLLTFSFTGYNQTEGKSKGLIVMNMAENGPASSNNSSVISAQLHDLTGKGGSVSPGAPQTMIGGIVQFTVDCDSVNECLVLRTYDSGLPDLVNYTPFINIMYKEPGAFIMSRPFVQGIAIAGDTVDGKLFVGDAYETIDSSYNGFAEFDNDINDLFVIHASDALEDEYVPITNGNGYFRLYYPYTDTTKIYYVDGEKSGFVDAYYSANGFEGEEIEIIWLEGTDSGCDHFKLIADENAYTVGSNAVMTVAAMKGDSVSRNYNSYVDISLSGTAQSYFDSVLPGNDGIAHFNVTDTVAGPVYVTVSDSIYSVTDTIYFVEGDEAAFIVCSAPSESYVGETYDVLFFAMTPDFRNDTLYNGIMTLIIEDEKGDTNSLSLSDNPDAISIVNGRATVSFSNADAERIGFYGYSVSGTDTIGVESTQLNSVYRFLTDGKTSINEIEDTLRLYITDYDSITAAYSTNIDSIYVEEEVVNSSVTITSPYNPIPVTDGEGIIAISDSETENVRIYAQYSDTLIENADVYRMIYELYSLTGIQDRNMLPERDYMHISSVNEGFVPIKFGLSNNADVNLSVYDRAGRMVKELYAGNLASGHYMMKWTGMDMNNQSIPEGVYFAVLNVDNRVFSGKIVIMR